MKTGMRRSCSECLVRLMALKLDFVSFSSGPGPGPGPGPEEAVGCDVAERLIEGQDTDIMMSPIA